MEPKRETISTQDSILFKSTGQITSLLSMIDGVHAVFRELDFNKLEQSQLLQLMLNLNTLFNYNRINIQLFVQYIQKTETNIFVALIRRKLASETKTNIFVALIRRYLASEKTEETALFRETLMTFFDFLFCHSDCSIEAYDCVYQSLSAYFFQKDALISEVKLLDHFNVLSHLYGYPLLPKQKPKNYFFFGGDCRMTFQINKEAQMPLGNGFCITTWFKPLSEVNVEGKPVKIIHLKTEAMEITLTIRRGNMLMVIVDSELPNTISLLPPNEWICLSMNISPIERCLHFKVNKMAMVTQKVTNLTMSSAVKRLVLYENYYGEATSIIMSNSSFALQNTNNCFNKYPVGIYKASQLDPLYKAFPIDKMLCLYTPIHSFEGKNTISDIIGSSEFDLGDECGVHCYHSYSKKISVFGGINQLLPLMELIYTSKLMTEQVIVSYLSLIVTVLRKCPHNLQEAEKSGFFSMLSIFIEKLPLHLFKNRLLDKFIEIKETMLKTPLIKAFFTDILLNEAILFKFPMNVQSILWNDLGKMAMDDISQFITYLPMNKVCLLLKSCDQARYEEYCCQEHADFFLQSGKPRVMEPSLMEKTQELRDLIEKIARRIDLSKTQDPMVFFEFLAFDLSPCLMKALLKLFLEITAANENIAYIHQYKGRINSIFLHLLMTSLPDIKCDILSFLFIINRHATLLPAVLQGIKSNLSMPSVFYRERPKGSITSEEIDSLAAHCRLKIESKIKEVDQCKSFNDKEPLLNASSCEKYTSMIYNCLLQFLFNKIIPAIHEDFRITAKDFIANPEMMSIIIEYAEKSNLTLKLLRDLHAVFKDNKDNCLKFYFNQSFYAWLIRKMHEGYSKPDSLDEQLQLAVSINNAIIKQAFGQLRDKTTKDPSFIFYYFFSFGIEEVKVGANPKSVNKFIQFVILNVFDFLQGLAKRSLDDPYYQSLMVLLSATIDFMTVFNLKRKRNKKPPVKITQQVIQPTQTEPPQDGENNEEGGNEEEESNKEKVGSPLNEPEISDQIILNQPSSSYRTIFPMMLFDGVNIDSTTESDKIEDIWADYVLFKKFFSFFSQTWFQSFLKFSNKNEADYIIANNETIMENLLLNQQNKNIFSLNIKELTFQRGMYTHGGNFLFCFVIVLTHSKNEEDISKWLNEFKIFLLFNLLAASNLTSSDKTNDYQLIQGQVMDMLGFSIIFLSECYQKRSGNEKELFKVIVKIVFSLCCIIQGEIYRSEANKTVLSIFKKNPVKELYNTCVNRLFEELFVDAYGEVLLTEQRLAEIKAKRYTTVPELFNAEPWKTAINSRAIEKRAEKLFCLDTYIRKRAARFNERPTIHKEEFIETRQILKTIKSIVDSRLSEWLQFTNGSFLNIKQKQLQYKKEKKKMFQWKGMWADRTLFFDQPNQLKMKLMNHLTKSFAKPLLCAILDIDYYVPHFTYFTMKQLFRQEEVSESSISSVTLDQSYIKLNINNIVNSLEENKEDTRVSTDTPTLFKEIYLNYNEELWKTYSNCNAQVFQRKEDNTFNLISGVMEKSKDEKLKPFEKEYQCCRVKLSHHVKGVLCLNKSGAIFKVAVNQKASPTENKHNIDYDDSRKTCFGSYFVFHLKDQDTITYTFPYQHIRYFFRRNYYHRNTALELILVNNKSFFLNFTSSQDREEALASIREHLPKQLKPFKIQNLRAKDEYNNIIGYENMFNPSPFLAKRNRIKMKKLIDAWRSNSLSNFDLIMCLNLFSNRSYSDLSQYPVFPWIISNYADQEVALETDLRDLSLPMGMITFTPESVARKNLFLENYTERNSKDVADEPFFFGSHYSNPIYTTHYMTRIFPYSHIMVELQGNTFDDPNRLFLSIEGSFKSASTQKSDVRELIPEFFYLPELFININQLNLGKLSDGSTVNDAKCPNWSKNDPYLFIKKHREYLENEKVSASINKWIDLIFGKKQRGKEAIQALNVFFPRSYDLDIENASKEEHLRYRAEVEFGLCPKQIFSEDFPSKAMLSGKQITKGKLAIEKVLPLKKAADQKPHVLLGFRVVREESALTFFDTNETIISHFNEEQVEAQAPVKEVPVKEEARKFKIPSFLFQVKKDETKQVEDTPKKLLCLAKLREYYSIGSFTTKPIRIKKLSRIIQGGFFDGKIMITLLDPQAKETHLVLENKQDTSPISAVEADDGNGLVFGANLEGRITVFHFNLSSQKWEVLRQLINHSKRVNYIFYSTYMNLLVSCSSDGYINFYTVPLLKHFRSIYLKNKSCDYVFIASSPLPSLLVISNNDNSFVSYSINGKYLAKANEDSRIKSPIVYTDSSFCDYVIYITLNIIKIRALPYLEEVNEINVEDKKIEFIDISESRRIVYAVDDVGSEIIVIRSYQ